MEAVRVVESASAQVLRDAWRAGAEGKPSSFSNTYFTVGFALALLSLSYLFRRTVCPCIPCLRDASGPGTMPSSNANTSTERISYNDLESVTSVPKPQQPGSLQKDASNQRDKLQVQLRAPKVPAPPPALPVLPTRSASASPMAHAHVAPHPLAGTPSAAVPAWPASPNAPFVHRTANADRAAAQDQEIETSSIQEPSNSPTKHRVRPAIPRKGPPQIVSHASTQVQSVRESRKAAVVRRALVEEQAAWEAAELELARMVAEETALLHAATLQEEGAPPPNIATQEVVEQHEPLNAPGQPEPTGLQTVCGRGSNDSVSIGTTMNLLGDDSASVSNVGDTISVTASEAEAACLSLERPPRSNNEGAPQGVATPSLMMATFRDTASAPVAALGPPAERASPPATATTVQNSAPAATETASAPAAALGLPPERSSPPVTAPAASVQNPAPAATACRKSMSWLDVRQKVKDASNPEPSPDPVATLWQKLRNTKGKSAVALTEQPVDAAASAGAVASSSEDAAMGGDAGEELVLEGEPNIFFQNARFSGRAPTPDRLRAHQQLPSKIYFFVRVTDANPVSLVKPLPAAIRARLQLAIAVEGYESAGPTASFEFIPGNVFGFSNHRLDAVKSAHSLQLVIEVPSFEAYPQQSHRIEPTSFIFQPYQSTSRHGSWLPRINVPIWCRSERTPVLRIPPPVPEIDGDDDDDGKVKRPSCSLTLGNPYAAPSPCTSDRSSLASLASERRLHAAAKRPSTCRLLGTEQQSLKLPIYSGSNSARSTASARSLASSLSTRSIRGSPPRDKFYPREFVVSDIYSERLRQIQAEKQKQLDLEAMELAELEARNRLQQRRLSSTGLCVGPEQASSSIASTDFAVSSTTPAPTNRWQGTLTQMRAAAQKR